MLTVTSLPKKAGLSNNVRFMIFFSLIIASGLLVGFFRALIFPPMSVMTWRQFLFICGAVIASITVLFVVIIPAFFQDIE